MKKKVNSLKKNKEIANLFTFVAFLKNSRPYRHTKRPLINEGWC